MPPCSMFLEYPKANTCETSTKQILTDKKIYLISKPKMESVFGRVRNDQAETRKYGIISMKAGKLNRKPGTKILQADHRKGILYLQLETDELLHFYWKERSRNSTDIEDDFIIFPDEADFIKIDQCTTGRVYALRFKSSSQIHFYWMQEYSDEKDEETVSLVNQLIADPSNVTRSINARNNASSRSRSMDDTSSANQFLQLFGATSQDSLQDFNWEVLSPTAEAPGFLPRFSPMNESVNQLQPTNDSATEPRREGETASSMEDTSGPAFDVNEDYSRSQTLDMLEQLSGSVENSTTPVEPFAMDDEMYRVVTHPRISPKLFPHAPPELIRDSRKDELSQNRDFYKHFSSLQHAIVKPEFESLRSRLQISSDQISGPNGLQELLKSIYDRMVAEGVIVITRITHTDEDGNSIGDSEGGGDRNQDQDLEMEERS
ncbi:19S proteasome regulatory subunit [Schizosaccharomyces cryophilus OY26]|uniref:19S proteasome regulatory subunit n=1 Tax=Schizosaccharomyces cryophilus (strain OY26 / ATCC MYA-4695 / CBS 11777 / NBRC 106824 / NRRL Y48691) TaxID=653667 RepID=S9VUL2_SCHCR|nr:19S proteasome regulatory subunit [Schizosaccharomyces cryophilus OY26]EPY49785.1 19S proteasome regulatory subunit [Schizosaccharomyces cryophilus OY26]